MGADFSTNINQGNTMRITLTNSFHNTSANLVLKSSVPSAYQVKRSRKILCGSKQCMCGNIMGMHGDQEHVKIVGQEYSILGLVPRFVIKG